MFIVIAIAILGIYAGTNVYILRSLLRWLGLHGLGAALFGGVYALLALGYVLSLLAPMPAALSKLLSALGGTFMAGYIFLLLAVPLAQLMLRGKGGPTAAFVILGLMAVYMGVGLYMAQNIQSTGYTVENAKGRGLRLVLISDLHIGEIIGQKQVADMVDAINRADADYVLMAGDIFDSGPGAVPDLDAVGKELSRIKSRKGVYACFGNHDGGFRGQETWAAELLEGWGIHVLQDEAVLLDDLTIVGRLDKGFGRMTAAQLTEGLDQGKMIVMLDHQPAEVEQAKAAGVDLLLCGHTHKGQVFPVNFITNAMFRIDYGQLTEDDFTAIVSSGAGTWGPRMRVGSVCEVVTIDIQ